MFHLGEYDQFKSEQEISGMSTYVSVVMETLFD